MLSSPRVVVVLITAPDQLVAAEIARTLVAEGLAACCNIVPQIRSLYRWQGELCDEPETLLLIKTTPALLPTLTDRARAIHPYTLPEIIALPVLGGSEEYLSWVEQTLLSPPPPQS
ncbi:MAG: divalent-cation tolerance protein CutA [Hydrogenophilus sp.]|nr:divalent-cation tolerance protein CutA [Hydrogenophilus sp.]